MKSSRLYNVSARPENVLGGSLLLRGGQLWRVGKLGVEAEGFVTLRDEADWSSSLSIKYVLFDWLLLS